MVVRVKDGVIRGVVLRLQLGFGFGWFDLVYSHSGLWTVRWPRCHTKLFALFSYRRYVVKLAIMWYKFGLYYYDSSYFHTR